MTVSVPPVCPDILAFRGSTLAAFDELAQARTLRELLRTAHRLWCGPSCPQDVTCPFLHYRRTRVEPTRPQAVRSRYNRDTAHLFTLMGGDGYTAGTPKTHEVDGWPLLERVLAEVDIARSGGRLALDYTDWTKKGDPTPARTVSSVCRDALQWMACWCGERYAADSTAVRYIALTTVVDDICVPPLDLLDGSFRIYGRCARDLVEAMEREGWGRDGTHVLLSLVRQYLMQYAEKVSAGVHAELSRSAEVWDSVVYRTHTANTYAAAVVIARVTGCGPLTTGWIMDSAICDAISMDLCKSATQVYQQDDHQPTRGPLEAMRHIGYHSAYLDLMDDLVYTGAPEPLVHFGRAGFLFVQLQDRYQERAAGRRFPIRPAMARLLRSLFGDAPTDTRLDKLFHPRGRSDSVRD